MRKISNLATQTCSVGSSEANCMPWEEYLKKCESGELTHGVYVCGKGYCLPPTTVYGCSSGCGSGYSSGCGWEITYGCSSGSEEYWDYGCSGSGYDWNYGQGDSGSESASGSGSGTSHSGGGTGGSTGTGGSSGSSSSGGASGSSSGNTGSSSSGSSSSEPVADILRPSDFKGYKASESDGCLKRCKEMLLIAGCKLVEYSSDSNIKTDIAIMKYNSSGRATVPSARFAEGVDYINSQLQMGHPVIVSVDYRNGTSMNQEDKAGDHFVIIVGGSDTAGYHFYDPATSRVAYGTRSELVFTMQNGVLYSSATALKGKDNHYVMSGVRLNK